jgi:S-adenosylmethionine hydrolase
VIYTDSFGNMKLTGVTADLVDAMEGLDHGELLDVRFSGHSVPVRMPWAPTFGDVPRGSFLMYEDSYGRLCIAQNQGNAAETLRVPENSQINVRRAGLSNVDRGRLAETPRG